MTKFCKAAIECALANYIAKGEGDPEKALVHVTDKIKLLEHELWALEKVKSMVELLCEEMAK